MCSNPRGIFASTRVENLLISSCVLDLSVTPRYPVDAIAELGEKTMNVKSMIVLAAVVAAVALGACRREEYRPLKLGAGADMPVAEKAR